MDTVRVLYKSGNSIDVSCENLRITRNSTAGLAAVEWSKCKPRPLFFNVDEVESIYILNQRSQ